MLVELILITMSSTASPPFSSNVTVMFCTPVHEAIPIAINKKAKIIKNFRIPTPPNLLCDETKKRNKRMSLVAQLIMLLLFSLILQLNQRFNKVL